MDKKIKIQAQVELDQAAFDKQIRDVQQKYNNLQKQNQGFARVGQTLGTQQGSPMSDYTKAFYGDFNRESINKLREAFNLNTQKLQSEHRDLLKKQQELKNLSKIESDLTKEQAGRVKLLQTEVGLIKERGRALLQQAATMKTTATGLGSDLTGFEGIGGSGTSNPQLSILQRMGGAGRNLLGKVGGVTGLLGTAGLLAQTGIDIGQHRITRDRGVLGGLGEQSGIASASLRYQLSGQGSRTLFEQGERRQALDMSLLEMSRQSTLDTIKPFSNVLRGAGIGAAGGSIVPGLGTAAGAAIGAGVGAYQTLSDPRMYNRLFDQTAYRTTLQTEALQHYDQNLNAQKAIDPTKFLSQEMWHQNWGRMQGMERTLGTGTSGLMDWYSRNQRSGIDGKARFSRERVEQAMGELIGAGASSEYVSGTGSQFVSQLQQTGILNAGSAVGRVAGIGGVNTNESIKKLLAEAMELGIDNSALTDVNKKFTADMRRLLDINVQLLKTTAGATGAVDQFQMGITGAGGVELEGALSAFNIRNKMAGQGTGYRGAMKWAYMSSGEGQEALGGLSVAEKSFISNANLSNLNPSDPRIKYMSDKLGITPDEMLDRIRTVQQQGMGFSPEIDQLRKGIGSEYESYRTSQGGISDTVSSRTAFAESKAGYSAIGKYLTAMGLQEGGEFANMNAQEALSFALGEAGMKKGEVGALSSTYSKLESGLAFPMQTPTDIQERSLANDELSNLKMLNDNMGKLVEASTANANASIEQINSMNQLRVSIDNLKNYLDKGGDITPEMSTFIEKLYEQAGVGEGSWVPSQPQGGNNNTGK